MVKEKKRRTNRAKNQRRVTDLEVLHQVGLALASIRDPDELVQHAVDVVREAFGYYYVVFLAYDAADDVLWPAAYSGEQPAPPNHMRFPLDQGITGLVAQQREPIIVNDTSTEPRYLEGGIPGVGSEAAFPIQRGEQLFGVLSVTSQEPDVFDEEAARTLTALANQIAVALENAQLFVEGQRRVQELTTLTAISTALNQALTLEETLDQVIQAVADVLGEVVCSIVLVDESSDTLRMVAARHLPADMVERFNQRAVPRDAGTFGVAIQTGELVEITETQADPHAPHGLSGIPDELTSVPLRTRDGVAIGVLVLGALLRDEDTRQLVLALAELAAVAIQRARQFDEEQRRREEATTLRDVGAAITASLDLPTILRAIHEATAPALNADTFYVALYDEVQQLLSFEFVVDADAEMEPFTLPLDQTRGLTSWVIHHRQPLLLRDIMEESPIEPIQRGEAVQSSVMIPIMSQDRLIGVIAAQSQEPNTFDERHQWLLSAVADQAAIAIENARLYQQARAVEQGLSQQVNVLTTLLSVAHALQAPGDLQPKLDLVAQGVVDAGLWRRAVISVFDDEWRAVSIGTAGLTPEEVTTLRQVPHRSREERMQFYDERFRISASYYIPHDADVSAGCVESHRQVEEFVDWHPDDRLLVPLYGEGGRIIGQLSVDDPVDGRRPTAESLKPLELFANQAAVVVENARLFAGLQLMNKDLEGVLESQLELLKAVQELSSPVVPIFEGVLVMPLVGAVDFSRAQQITYDLLAAIEAERARFAIIDITGVPMVDSHVARYLADAMQATRLVGTEPVLVGITPAVAQTMVEIRADLGDVTTCSDLQSGVAYALRQLSREGRQRNPGPSSPSERKT